MFFGVQWSKCKERQRFSGISSLGAMKALVTPAGTRIVHRKSFPVANQQTTDLPVRRSSASPNFPDCDECDKGGGTVCECTVEIMEANLCFHLAVPMRITDDVSSTQPQDIFVIKNLE
jgi:hypothetical protein